MEYAVAIPSYRRAKTLRDNTLALLSRTSISASSITVFVADDDEEREYRAVLPAEQYGKLVVAVPGMAAVRNFISDFYPEGTRILWIDDDMKDVVRFVDKETMESIVPTFSDFVKNAFSRADMEGASMWGIYPACNPFFKCTKEVTSDLRYCPGGLYGTQNFPELRVDTDDKEDFQRTIKAFERDGKVVRFNWVSFVTSCFSTKGGMQEARTLEGIQRAADALVARWPQYARARKNKRRGKYAGVTLKRTKVRLPLP